MRTFLVILNYLNVRNNLFFKTFFKHRMVLVSNLTVNKGSKTATLSYSGYLLGMDRKYYYLGDTLTQVTHGVHIDNVISWECLDIPAAETQPNKKVKSKDSEYDEMLDELSDDVDSTKVN